MLPLHQAFSVHHLIYLWPPALIAPAFDEPHQPEPEHHLLALANEERQAMDSFVSCVLQLYQQYSGTLTNRFYNWWRPGPSDTLRCTDRH